MTGFTSAPVPVNQNPCPFCGSPMSLEPATTSGSHPGYRDEAIAESWGCSDCGQCWTPDDLPAAREAAQAAAIIADVLGQSINHPGTRRLASDLEGGVA